LTSRVPLDDDSVDEIRDDQGANNDATSIPYDQTMIRAANLKPELIRII
jgi:hypothetical protein